MSRYVVRIIGPSGHETFLSRGHETAVFENATRYSHPSNAKQAEAAYFKVSRGFCFHEVIDASDPEKRIL